MRSPYTTAREQPQLSKTRESLHAATKTQYSQNKKNVSLYLKKKKKNLKNRKSQDLAQHPPVSLRISTHSLALKSKATLMSIFGTSTPSVKELGMAF